MYCHYSGFVTYLQKLFSTAEWWCFRGWDPPWIQACGIEICGEEWSPASFSNFNLIHFSNPSTLLHNLNHPTLSQFPALCSNLLLRGSKELHPTHLPPMTYAFNMGKANVFVSSFILKSAAQVFLVFLPWLLYFIISGLFQLLNCGEDFGAMYWTSNSVLRGSIITPSSVWN